MRCRAWLIALAWVFAAGLPLLSGAWASDASSGPASGDASRSSAPPPSAPATTLPPIQPLPSLGPHTPSGRQPIQTITIESPHAVLYFCFAPDGQSIYYIRDAQAINLWAVAVYHWPELLGVGLVLVFGILLWRLVRLWQLKRIPGEPYCRKCSYHLRGSEAETCPECGAALAGKGTVIGRRPMVGPWRLVMFLLGGGILFGAIELSDPPRRIKGASNAIPMWSTTIGTWLAENQIDIWDGERANLEWIEELDLRTGQTRRRGEVEIGGTFRQVVSGGDDIFINHGRMIEQRHAIDWSLKRTIEPGFLAGRIDVDHRGRVMWAREGGSISGHLLDLEDGASPIALNEMDFGFVAGITSEHVHVVGLDGERGLVAWNISDGRKVPFKSLDVAFDLAAADRQGNTIIAWDYAVSYSGGRTSYRSSTRGIVILMPDGRSLGRWQPAPGTDETPVAVSDRLRLVATLDDTGSLRLRDLGSMQVIEQITGHGLDSTVKIVDGRYMVVLENRPSQSPVHANTAITVYDLSDLRDRER